MHISKVFQLTQLFSIKVITTIINITNNIKNKLKFGNNY